MRLEAYAHHVKTRAPTNTGRRKGWLKRINEAVAPLVNFDNKAQLQFRGAMCLTYASRSIQGQTLPGLKDELAKKPFDLRFEYEALRAPKRGPSDRMAHPGKRTKLQDKENKRSSSERAGKR